MKTPAVLCLGAVAALAAARAEPPAPLPRVELTLSGKPEVKLSDKPVRSEFSARWDEKALGGSSAKIVRTEVEVVRANGGALPGLRAAGGGGGTGGGTAPATTGPAEVKGSLRWNNGESLPGELAGASASGLTWKSPLFDEPLALEWGALRRFEQAIASQPTDEPFAFHLRDGGHIYGNLVAVTADTVAIHSERHGDALLRRSQVLSARRLHGGSLLACGPAGDVAWNLLSNRRGDSDFKVASSGGRSATVPLMGTGPGGALLLPYWNTGVFHEVALPDQVDLEFRVRASKRPDFFIALEGRPKQSLKISTWEDELVLSAGDQFQSLGKLADTERTVALRVCWDRRTGHVGVYTPAGEPMASLDWPAGPQAPGKSDFRPALILQNKGRDLALEFVRVRSWDGSPPAPVALEGSAVELADGRTIPGEIIGGSAGSMRLRVGGADAVVGFPVDRMDALVFSSAAPVPTPEPGMTLTWADGTYLTGAVAGIADGKAALQTAFTDAPLSARTDGLRLLLLRPPGDKKKDPPERPLDQWDKITTQDVTLHGTMACAGDGQPRWLPVGGLQPVRLAPNLAYEIDRALPPSRENHGAPALFYTSAGDILPGTLRALDRTGVDFDSDYVESKKFLPADLNAIQFNTDPHAQIDGFSDANWQVAKGNAATVVRKEGTLKMEAGTMLAHPSAMQCSELSFQLDTSNYCAVRLRMFCAGTDPARSVNLMLMQSGQTLYYGIETSENQMDTEQQANTSNGAVKIRIGVTDRQVDFYVDGARLQSFPVPPSKRAGSGLILEPASLWGNSVQSIQLSNFSATFVPGSIRLPEVTAEAKSQALTVPRFRKDDPPRQVLIAANGDVLRGELEAATAWDFAFRSGLESLTVPRDRVKAAVWLKKPAEGLEPSPAAAVDGRLAKKSALDGNYGSMGLHNVVSMLLQADSGLKVKYPRQESNRRVRLRFDGPTIAEGLDQICTAFDLRYRLEGGDTIVLEEQGVGLTGMTRQTYWLKPDAFPGKETPQAVLATKGIAFPDDASARWDAGSRQLVVTNTDENQRKLAGVLGAEFGGVQGTPTHWLVLASGARLGLAVDRFGQDRITGHHPVYGHCEVPLSAVYAVRTSAPEENPAMKGFGDWRLAYAPEPVLPETGGESSPMLGKEPKTFKLPLLGGGEFDLAQEKGKVVVLDFWATWCGPCVQSLPGLIEAMSGFPEDRVRFVGLDQAEPATQVKRFLEARGWKLTVAMDAAQNVAQSFGVEGIPHTVIIGPDGKVAWVKTGYEPGNDAEAAETVKKLLAGPGGAPETPK